MYFRKPTKLTVTAALILASCLLASCSSGDTSSAGRVRAVSAGGSPSPASSSVRQTFTSPEYGYTVTLPAGWAATQAYSKWNGSAELVKDSLDVDRFFRASSSALSFAAAARWTHGLPAYRKFLIASTVRYHSDTCPSRPDKQAGIAIGGRPGVLLEYNCGILINIAATVRHGVGYVFTFRDDSVQAASDRTDHAVFVQMLRSVEFPV
jgi:hypothetical protein